MSTADRFGAFVGVPARMWVNKVVVRCSFKYGARHGKEMFCEFYVLSAKKSRDPARFESIVKGAARYTRRCRLAVDIAQ